MNEVGIAYLVRFSGGGENGGIIQRDKFQPRFPFVGGGLFTDHIDEVFAVSVPDSIIQLRDYFRHVR